MATARKDRGEGKRMLKSELRKRGIIATDNSIRVADPRRLDSALDNLARKLALALVGLDAPLRSFWHCFIPDFMPVSFSFTLMVAIIIAIILAKFIEGNIFKPLFRGRGNEDLLQFLENFIEDDAEGSKSKPRIPVMVETESGKIYIGYLVEFSLGSGEDPDSKFLIVRPSFSAIMKGSVLNVNTFYTPNDHTKNPQTKRIDVLIPWDTVKTVREFDWDYMLECVKTGTVEIDEKIASLITMESGE